MQTQSCICCIVCSNSYTPPEGMQKVRDDEVLKKALVPATWLEEETIQGCPLLPGGVPHMKNVHKEKMANEVWATPGFVVQGMSFYFRHHGRYYKLVPGKVLYSYLIFDTNAKFDLFEQHTCYGIAPDHELLFRAKDDEFIEPAVCIEVTIGNDVSFESATYRLIRNNGDMETVLDFPIPR